MSPTETSTLIMWVVYDHPSDYPDDFVARKWILTKNGMLPTETALSGPSIDLLRYMLAENGLSRMERLPEDDPVVLEVWL